MHPNIVAAKPLFIQKQTINTLYTFTSRFFCDLIGGRQREDNNIFPIL